MYKIKYTTKARLIRATLPPEAKTALDAKLNEIARNPESTTSRVGNDIHKRSASFGGGYGLVILHDDFKKSITVENITWAK